VVAGLGTLKIAERSGCILSRPERRAPHPRDHGRFAFAAWLP